MFHKNNTFYFCVLCNFLYIFPAKAYFTPVLKKAKIKHTRQVDYFSVYVDGALALHVAARTQWRS